MLTAVDGELLLFRGEGTTATTTTAGARQFLKKGIIKHFNGN
jgi:hypothetical protein